MPNTGPASSIPERLNSDATREFLSQYGAPGSDPFEYGSVDFMQAVRDGDKDTVARFIEKTDQFNPFFVCDMDDALSEAAAHGHEDIVRLLLDEGVTLDSLKLCDRWDEDITRSKGTGGWRCECRGTALQEASNTGSESLVSLLLERGANVNFEPVPHQGATALGGAARGGHARVVASLLAAGADVNAKPAGEGRTALQASAEGGHAEIVAILLAAGAVVNAEPARYGGRTALQAAAEGGYALIVKRLLVAGANVNAEPGENDGKTALEAAAEGGHAAIVESLLEAGADVNAKPGGNDGRTALQAAAEGGHAAIVKSLLAAGADVNAKPGGNDGRTALQAAAEGGHAAIVKRLLAAGADVNAEPGENDGRTALQAAAEGGHSAIVARLLAASADINAEPARYGGRTALQAAAEGGHAVIVEHLLAAGADVNAKPAQNDGRTALQIAAEGGHAAIVKSLLAAGADVNAKPAQNDGRPALQAAAEGGHAVIVEHLLAAGADINAEPARYGGRTALQAAAEGGHAAIVESLLAAGANVNAKPAQKDGRTALQAAAGGGHAEVVGALLAAGADVKAKPGGNDGRTALQAAAEGGHAAIIEILLAAGADVNAGPARYDGRTALQAASEGGHAAIVASLVTTGADINAAPAGRGGRTALQAAAEGGHAVIVEILVAAGADVNPSPSGGAGATALLAAIRWGDVKIVASLLSLGLRNGYVEDPGALPNTGSLVQQISAPKDTLSAINTDHLISNVTKPKILQFLLQAGISTSVLSKEGSSPLHYAVKQRNIRSIALLLLSGVDTNIRDQDNLTPFDLLRGSERFFRPQCLRIFLWLGCETRGRPIQLWHQEYNQYARKCFLTLTARPIPHPSWISPLSEGQLHPAAGGDQLQSGKLQKTSIQITSFDTLPSVEWEGHRSLHHSGRDIQEILRNPRQIVVATEERRFYALGDVGAGGGVICMRQWRWCRVKSDYRFEDQGGTGLPSHLKMDTTAVRGAFLTCSVSFDYLVQIAGQEAKPNEMGNAFKVAAAKSTINWTMRKRAPEPNQEFTPILRTIDFVSTLDIGWVPDDAVDFFNSFMVDLHKKWRVLLEEADTHLDHSRRILLKKQGKSAGFIEILLLDAQTWSDSRSLLQTQVRSARDILTDFRETKYLQDEIVDPPVSFDNLSVTIDRLEEEVLKEIKDLDDKTQKMIELEFNLVSIYESRTSKEMGMSMKRLSWITFIFLPLMFVASLFGMNVDIISGGPKWTWVIVLAISLFTVVILVWSLLKRFPIDEWIREHREQANSAKLKGNTQPKWYGWGFWRKEACEHDLELGETFQFTRPQRRWTMKLKDH